MMKNGKKGLWIFVLSFTIVTLACSFGGGSEPAQAPSPAEPTALPVEPTETPEAPSDAPEPTEVSAEAPTEQPSDESIAAPPADETELETPPPENAIYVKAVNGYRDDLGYLHIIGLVTNNTDRAVDNVEVEVDILNSDGNSLKVELTTIALYTLAPGETSPFSYWVSEELPDAKSYSASIVGQSAAEIERASEICHGY